MENCARCGHLLGAGRWCPGCGAAVESPDLSAWRTDTAERPALREVPPAPRYPLYADEVRVAPAAPRDRTRSRLPLVAGVAVLALVTVLGAVLLTGALAGDGAGEEGGDGADRPTTTGRPSQPATTSEPRQERTDRPARRRSSAAPPRPRPVDVAATAAVVVPATAPPSRGLDGTRTTYTADHLVDGDPGTAWRMPGDGTGAELVVDLARPTVVTRLGLVNGYAKSARDADGGVLDWYAGNRRVLAVDWLLDDGTVLRQDLARTRALQTVDVGSITTRTVRLRLVTVSQPGTGRAGRDYTALSGLAVVGLPG